MAAYGESSHHPPQASTLRHFASPHLHAFLLDADVVRYQGPDHQRQGAFCYGTAADMENLQPPGSKT